ncbi:MAG: MBL fold metallo-hydrolase [Armatimonadetes bacterium]|nr:MBL fold metallo-hydrolase [Armatimonadota bacterium]
MTPTLGFFGAAKTVTGSKHLLSLGKAKVLIDCGMYQGTRDLKDRNWQPFPFDPSELDAVVITHAHLDHIGMLPRLVKDGFTGPIYATAPTISLSRISLADSGRLQEEEARYHVRHGLRHDAKPLYDEDDAYRAMKQFKAVPFNTRHELPGGGSWVYKHAGHILGSAYAEIALPNGELLLMSGDLGRFDTPIIKDPEVVDYTDYLVIESTYGDRLHSKEDPMIKLEEALNWAWQNGGTILIPSFAIGRTQEMLFYFKMLQEQERMPRIPIYIDSPMATSVTKVYADAKDDHDDEMKISIAEGQSELEPTGLNYIRDREQSQALNKQHGPQVIIAGSGMANGGRIKHHLMHRLGLPETMVLFTGYQAQGTLGRELIEHAPSVSIFGQDVMVRAKVDKLNALSAHADQGEIMHWLSFFNTPPKKTFIVHGEPPAQEALAAKIRDEYGWDVVIPAFGDHAELSN